MKGISQQISRISLVTSLLLVLCLLFSCAKINVTETFEEDLKTGSLDLYVTLGGGVNSPLKTIAPPHLDVNNLSADYSFKLVATNSGQTRIERAISLQNGRASLTDIPSGIWHLELEARNGTNQVVLKGASSVTVEGGKTAQVSVTLTPVEGGTGTVNIQFSLNNDDFALLNGNAMVRIGLYNPLDYSLVTSQGSNLTQNIPYNVANIAAGMYIIRLTFTPTTNTNLPAGFTATWSDIIYVESHRETTVNPNPLVLPQLLRKPDAPTSPNHRLDNKVGDHFPVTLTWGGVYNANSYELEVLEYSSPGNPDTEQGWNALATQDNVKKYNAKPHDENNYTRYTNKTVSQYYMEGGLLPGQTSIKLALKEGTSRYAARMRAINSYGESSWMYFGDLGVTPLVVQRPNRPTTFNFTAGFYDDTTSSFLVNFTWTNITNADGYILELMTIKNNSTFTPPRSNTEWEQLKGTNIVVTYRGGNLGDADGDPCKYEGGSLLAGSTSAQVSIKRHGGMEYYAVRLCAYNDGGDSDWVYPLGMVPSAQRDHPILLMPFPALSYTSTPVGTNGSFSATITIKDISASTCFYHYEFISLPFPQNFSSIFNQTNLSNKNTEFRKFYDRGSNTVNFKINQSSTTFTLSGSTSTSILIRVRILTLSGITPRSATPWYYATKILLPGQTNVSL